MKKSFISVIIALVIASCNEQTVIISGSIGRYPNENICWVLLRYPDYRIVENATVTMNGSRTIPYSEEKGGYYRELDNLNFNSEHTVEVEVPDNQNITCSSLEIPSNFSVTLRDTVDTLVIQWTSAESMQTPPDSWRLTIRQFSDSNIIGYSSNEHSARIFPFQSFNDINVTVDAIKYGDLEGARSNSVFAGLVRKRKEL